MTCWLKGGLKHYTLMDCFAIEEQWQKKLIRKAMLCVNIGLCGSYYKCLKLFWSSYSTNCFFISLLWRWREYSEATKDILVHHLTVLCISVTISWITACIQIFFFNLITVLLDIMFRLSCDEHCFKLRISRISCSILD